MINVGDTLPNFTLPTHPAGEVSPATLLGTRTVLYFYPKDDTPGWTTEAAGFRDSLSQFTALNVQVIGVSPDDLKSHAKFAEKHKINFALVADIDKTLIQPLGLWVEKSMYGKKYWGVQRSTYVVAADGHIEKIWESVKPDGHAQEVFNYLK